MHVWKGRSEGESIKYLNPTYWTLKQARISINELLISQS